jgi:hypothetical protein
MFMREDTVGIHEAEQVDRSTRFEGDGTGLEETTT